MFGRSIVAGTVGLAAALLVACTPSGPAPPANTDGLLLAEPGDAAVAAAKAEAIKTLPIFWTKYPAKAPGDDDFALKAGFKVQGGGTEHMWTRPVSRQGDELVVRLANEPVYVADLKLGSEVRVLASDVSDWSYAHDGKLYGHFTTRALARNATDAERAEMDAMFAPTPLEPANT